MNKFFALFALLSLLSLLSLKAAEAQTMTKTITKTYTADDSLFPTRSVVSTTHTVHPAVEYRGKWIPRTRPGRR
jgi:hypothetical protein